MKTNKFTNSTYLAALKLPSFFGILLGCIVLLNTQTALAQFVLSKDDQDLIYNTQQIEFSRGEAGKQNILSKATVSDAMELMFFTTQGLKDLGLSIKEFDKVIAEAVLVRDSLTGTDEVDEMLRQKVVSTLRDLIEARRYALLKGEAWVGLLVMVDSAMWIPQFGLKAVFSVLGKFSEYVGANKVGAYIAELGYKAVLKISNAKKAIRIPFTKLGANIGLYGTQKWLLLKKSLVEEYLIPIRAFQIIENGMKHGKLKGIAKPITWISSKCGGLSPETQRLWLLSVVYSFPINFTTQIINRQSNFLQQFDQVMNDTSISLISHLTLGRCTSGLDKVSNNTFVEKWKQRQMSNIASIALDSGVTYAKMANDAKGFTAEDYEVLKRRMTVNTAYTLTRGTFVDIFNGTNVGEMNKTYQDLMKAGKTNEAMNVAASEFLVRYTNSLLAGSVYMSAREDYIQGAKTQQRLAAERDLKEFHALIQSVQQKK